MSDHRSKRRGPYQTSGHGKQQIARCSGYCGYDVTPPAIGRRPHQIVLINRKVAIQSSHLFSPGLYHGKNRSGKPEENQIGLIFYVLDIPFINSLIKSRDFHIASPRRWPGASKSNISGYCVPGFCRNEVIGTFYENITTVILKIFCHTPKL